MLKVHRGGRGGKKILQKGGVEMAGVLHKARGITGVWESAVLLRF